MAPKAKSVPTVRREELKERFWPKDHGWTLESVGWFTAPRSLPLVLGLLASKKMSGNQDPSKVYLELLSRHIDSGIIEMAAEDEHAFAAGYWGNRSVRTWRERMKIIEKYGFIIAKAKGNRRYGFVFLVHPSVVVETLRQKKLLPGEHWENAYMARQVEAKETTYSKLMEVEKKKKKANP